MGTCKCLHYPILASVRAPLRKYGYIGYILCTGFP